MRHARLPSLLSLLVALVGLAGCSVDVCEAETPPEPFEEIVGDLPSEAVFCKAGEQGYGRERVDFPAPGEDWPEGTVPNIAHLNFDLATAHDAWMKLIDTLEGKGWQRADQSTDEDNLSLVFAHVDKGYVLDFEVINTTSSSSPIKRDRVHAHVKLQKVPCIDNPMSPTCVDDKLVYCFNGYPQAEVDCAANQQSCGINKRNAACVSDLCMVSKASSGRWSRDDCPAELFE